MDRQREDLVSMRQASRYQTSSLTEARCPECNGRMRHTGRRRYRCNHCKRGFRSVITLIKTALMPEKKR